jgi:uncharacterized protein YaiI (UPF0178 family)
MDMIYLLAEKTEENRSNKSEDYSLLHIFIDADACPVKNEVYKVASRYNLDVTLVSNSWMRVPKMEGIVLKVVNDDLDAADDWIVQQVKLDDIVITADVLLAGRCLKKGAHVLGTNGKPLTDNNIGEAIATRDLLNDLRSAGETTGGPPPLRNSDRSYFLQQLDQIINKIYRNNKLNPT